MFRPLRLRRWPRRARATGEGDGKPDGGSGDGDEDLHPGAPGWRQAVDDHYASLADALETMDPDERARFEDDYARTTGVLPGPVLKQVRGGLLSADPAAQAAAAQRLARLKDVDPALVSAIPPNERRRAGAIAEFADLGLTPARAVELAAEKPAGAGDDALTGGDAGDDMPDDIVIDDTGDGAARKNDGREGVSAGDEQLAGAFIRKALQKLLQRQRRSESRKRVEPKLPPVPVGPDVIIDLVHKKLQETNENKVTFTVPELGEGVANEDAIKAFVEAVLSGRLTPDPSKKAQLKFGPVSDNVAHRVKTDTGLDVGGFVRVIEADEVIHAFERHGPGKERRSGQVPISPDAVAIYLEVVENPDKVTARRRKGLAPTILYEKRVDGFVVAVEEVRAKKKALAFKSMWIKRKN